MLTVGSGQGLLANDVFSGIGGGDHDVSVRPARDADTHHIDLRLCQEFRNAAKHVRDSVATSKVFGPMTVSSDDADERDIGPRDPFKGLGLEICTKPAPIMPTFRVFFKVIRLIRSIGLAGRLLDSAGRGWFC